MLDIGCGAGISTTYFDRLGCEVLGLEGVPQKNPFVWQHDFTKGPYIPPRRYDLGWCCEFVEHVEERYVPNFTPAFRACDLVLLTYAEPGQPGYHHVNCQPEAYWRGVMAAIGYTVDAELTYAAREQAALNTFSWEDEEGLHVNHFLRSGLAFVTERFLGGRVGAP